MRRAAIVARERAARFGLKIPIWKDGDIVFVDPSRGTQENGSANFSSEPVVPPFTSSE